MAKSLSIGDGSTFKVPKKISIGQSSAYKTVKRISIGDGGAWKLSYTSGIELTGVTVPNQFSSTSQSDAWWSSFGPQNIQKLVNGASMVTPADDGSYTYLWEFISNNSSTGGAPTFNRSDGVGTTDTYSIGSQNPGFDQTISRSEDWRLTVTDSRNNSFSDTFIITVSAVNEGSS